MKRLFCIVFAALLCLGLCACDSAPAPVVTPEPAPEVELPAPTIDVDTPEEPSVSDVPEEPAEVVSQIRDIVFTRCEAMTDGVFTEYAQITGVGESGEILWDYTTDQYEVAQMSLTSEIGRTSDRYYFCENGTVVALDPNTGEVLWKNADFDGAPAQDQSCLIDDDGTVYLCGYLGPDFYAVDADGNTIFRTSTFSEDYWWPYALEKQGDKIAITFEMGPGGSDTENGYDLYVDLNDFSWSLEN